MKIISFQKKINLKYRNKIFQYEISFLKKEKLKNYFENL